MLVSLGSRELEYPEFKQIIVDKLGLGAKTQHKTIWAQNAQGEWSREYPADTWFGEKCLLEADTTMSLTLLALEPTTIAYMDQQEFLNICENGFDGDLNNKVGSSISCFLFYDISLFLYLKWLLSKNLALKVWRKTYLIESTLN